MKPVSRIAPTPVMRHESHRTTIATLLDYVQVWRKRSGWSRETVVQAIVDMHDAIEGPANTGIRFEPHTTDAFERTKVNADRVFRWLDDSTKDTNLLPANFVPTVLAALPSDLRLHCVEDLLRPLGIGAREIVADTDPSSVDALKHLRAMTAEDADAVQAVVDLIDGATHEELKAAQQALADKAAATNRALADVEAALATTGAPRL
jgi:hypothetical protein